MMIGLEGRRLGESLGLKYRLWKGTATARPDRRLPAGHLTLDTAEPEGKKGPARGRRPKERQYVNVTAIVFDRCSAPVSIAA
jgi:hypothetical protein